MAFTLNTFQFNRGIATCANNGTDVGTVTHGYKSTGDTYVTITAPGYFPDFMGNNTDKIFAGDLIFIVASDTVGLAKVNSVAPFSVGANLLGTAGSPITVGAPISAVDTNAIKVTGSVVQMEKADATHPGIITQFDQEIAGIKDFQSGVKFMTFGGTPTTLNYYEEYDHVTTFDLGTETTAPATFRVTRVGRLINIYGIDTVSTPAQGAPGVAFVANTALPARFRPDDFVNGFWRIQNGTIYKAGMVQVDSNGVLIIYNDADSSTPYTAGQITSIRRGFLTYSM